jgi:hypothetical protein
MCMGEMRNVYKIWLGSLKGTDHLEDLGINGRIILKCILQKCVLWMIALIWLRIGTRLWALVNTVMNFQVP